MRYNHAQIYRGGRFVPGSISFERAILDFDEGEGVDLGGCYVIPGLIDLHTHGAMGADGSDGKAENMRTLGLYYAAHGVTSYCCTTMTLHEPELTAAVRVVRDHVRGAGEAKCAGVHLEGPFLSYAKRGAQGAEHLQAPDIDMFHRLNEASGHQVRLITVAPEIDGALDFIREASRCCTVSLGHSAADYAQAMAGFEAGASHVTHLFNGMQPLHHREPGLVGAALSAGAAVELICDGLHIHPAVILGTWKMFGDKLVIISDSLRCAGLPDGDYDLAGQPIVVQNGRATLLNGTLAGSSSNLHQELRNVVSYGIPLEAAIHALTEAPARELGLFDSIGSLDVGKAADLLVLDRDLRIRQVVIDGKPVAGQL